MTKQPVYAQYIGAGAFVGGVPARDLTEVEWKELTEEARALALEVGTHKLIKSGSKAADAEA